jgi:hypothetical protein
VTRSRAARRSRLSAAILAAASACFLLLSVRLIRSRGPIEWVAPSTVLSNSHPAQRNATPLLLFLRDVRPLLPPGARVAVIGPDARNDSAPLDDLIAIGQLPRNDVVPFRGAVDRTIPPPEFLAVHLWDYSDDRYRVVAVLETGRLYELRH